MKTIRLLFAKAAPEWVVVEVLLLLTLVFQHVLRAPFRWFAPGAFIFVETSYLLPFAVIIVSVVLMLPFFRHRKKWSQMAVMVGRPFGDLVCFTLILLFHFHLKLWSPLIHPVSYDSVYEAIDRHCFFWLDPLIAWRSHWPPMDWVDHLYANLFIGMFLVSFVVHSWRGRAEFRRVFLASVLVQALGAVSYLIAPAVGPFLYHPSANVWTGQVQHDLLAVRSEMLAGGLDWLRHNTGRCLACGLAAMPSLHTAASFVFVYYAWKHARWLCFLYGPAFGWILFEAMASRWHYGVDLFAGMALAFGCIALANCWMRVHESASREFLVQIEEEEEPLPDALPDLEPCRRHDLGAKKKAASPVGVS